MPSSFAILYDGRLRTSDPAKRILARNAPAAVMPMIERMVVVLPMPLAAPSGATIFAGTGSTATRPNSTWPQTVAGFRYRRLPESVSAILVSAMGNHHMLVAEIGAP